MFPRKCTFFYSYTSVSSSVNNTAIIFKSRKFKFNFWNNKNKYNAFLLFKVKCNKDIYKYGTTCSLISHNVMFIGP